MKYFYVLVFFFSIFSVKANSNDLYQNARPWNAQWIGQKTITGQNMECIIFEKA